METGSAPPKKRNFKPYVIGAGLCYSFCLITYGRLFAAGESWSLGLAITGALFFWPFIAPIHAILQLLLSLILKLIWKANTRHAWIVLNIPIILLIIVEAFHANNEARRAFKSLVANPIPASVQIVKFNRTQSIGEPMRLGIMFEIQKKDLQGILHIGGYTPVTDNRAWMSMGRLLDPKGGILHFVSTNDQRRNIFIQTNRPEVYFIYAMPDE